jgi:hypothetical protein
VGPAVLHAGNMAVEGVHGMMSSGSKGNTGARL